MKKVNLVEMSDLLFHAESLGYEWNKACDILRDVRPEYEITSLEYNKTDFDPGCEGEIEEYYSQDTLKIMSSYFKKKRVKDITVVRG